MLSLKPKKLVSWFTSIVLALSGLVAAAIPAHADTASTYVGAVGTTINENWYADECNPAPGATPTYFQDGELPPGITLNTATGYISGTYTQAGTFSFSARVGCSWFEGEINPSRSRTFTTEFIVYQEAAEAPVAPTLNVLANADEFCSLDITGIVPAEQDYRTLKLSIRTPGQSSGLEMTLNSQPANTPFTVNIEIDGEDSINDPDIATVDDYDYFGCNETLNVTLSYRYHVSPIATTTETVITRFSSHTLTPKLMEQAYPAAPYCTVVIEGWFPSSGDVGTRPTLTLTAENSIMMVYPYVESGGYFSAALPLDDMSLLAEFDDTVEIAQGTAPACGEFFDVVASYTLDGVVMSSQEEGFLGYRYCQAGSFDSGTACVQAPAGSYVSADGATAATLCPKGTFQGNTGSTSCIDAPIGYYVGTKGATQATQCPSSKVTAAVGATHVSECYSLKSQTFTSFKGSTKLKFNAFTLVPLVTDNQLDLEFRMEGRCAYSTTTMKVKVGKTTRTVPAMKITAGVEATVCRVTLLSNGNSIYKPYVKTHNIKVSRTGK
ncbi:MAG: Tyrosine-protein kinase ephrin type receptor-like [Actinomycetota bacterium]